MAKKIVAGASRLRREELGVPFAARYSDRLNRERRRDCFEVQIPSPTDGQSKFCASRRVGLEAASALVAAVKNGAVQRHIIRDIIHAAANKAATRGEAFWAATEFMDVCCALMVFAAKHANVEAYLAGLHNEVNDSEEFERRYRAEMHEAAVERMSKARGFKKVRHSKQDVSEAAHA